MSKPPSQPPILRSRRTPGAKNGVSNSEEFQTPQAGIQQTSNGLREPRPAAADAGGVVGWPEHWAKSAEVAPVVAEPDRAALPVRQMRPALRQIEPPVQQVEPPEHRRERERQAEPAAKRSSFLQRLSELVGNRREA
jgi:hypothetical protein